MLPLHLQLINSVTSVDCFLKMLIVLCVVPVAAPSEAVLGKETIAQIVLINFIGEVLTAVSVSFTSGGRDIGVSVSGFVKDDIRVVVRVDVYGKAIGMLGKACGAVHYSVIKTGGIVICHGGGVVAAVLIY